MGELDDGRRMQAEFMVENLIDSTSYLRGLAYGIAMSKGDERIMDEISLANKGVHIAVSEALRISRTIFVCTSQDNGDGHD